jgi:hypothetical protein
MHATCASMHVTCASMHVTCASMHVTCASMHVTCASSWRPTTSKCYTRRNCRRALKPSTVRVQQVISFSPTSLPWPLCTSLGGCNKGTKKRLGRFTLHAGVGFWQGWAQWAACCICGARIHAFLVACGVEASPQAAVVGSRHKKKGSRHSHVALLTTATAPSRRWAGVSLLRMASKCLLMPTNSC